MRLVTAAAVLLLAAPLASAQALWTDVSEAALRPAAGTRVTVPSAYRVVRLDVPQMAARLAAAPDEARPGAGVASGTTLPVPLPDGTVASVRVAEASVMAPALQAAYPEIRTYLAQGEGSVSGRLSLTPAGFRGMLFTPQGTVFLDAYARGDAEHLVVYYGRDLEVDRALRGRTADEVLSGEAGETAAPRGPGAARANGATLRTYRLAVAATGEYTAFHGGTVAGGLAAIVATVNRVTGVYERELSVRFQLVATNNLIVYTNATTDPYANTSGDLTANRNTLNSVIGSANFDVGHLVGTGGGGVASLGVVCSASKAQGLTGSPAPVGDAFDIDYVAHEMGHQFGGNHTFNGNTSNCGSGNRNASTAYEPGSGSTIQAYAGICGAANDLQLNSDAYFHAASLDEMTAHITTGSGGTCGTTAATGNTIPTVTAPAAVTVPISTPFALTGSATDDAPGALTFAWEEMDLGTAGAPGTATPPLFRSFSPAASGTRVFPQLTRLVAGTAPVLGERLPTDARTLSFRLTARDNRSGGGAINDAATTVTTTAAAGPFTVSFAPTTGLSFAGTATVTWNVAGTTAAPVSTPTVDIVLSTDNGATFTTVLAAATPNDGSELVSFPVSTTQGRILVRAVGNVFFNVNPQRFTATAATQTVAGTVGWRLLAPAAQGLTVADLAALNLVQGVPGYYPTAGANLYTGYDGAAYTRPAGGSDVLAPGRGFWWRFYNIEGTPGGPSTSHALPTTLATSRPAVTTDTPVVLTGTGTKYTLLGNPFGTSLNVSGVASWPGASALASTVVQMWNAASSGYETSVTRPTIAPWQGFWAEGASAGTLTIPASARTTGGTLRRDAPVPTVALELASEDPGSGAGSAFVDRAAVLTFGPDARDGRDTGDAVKLDPLAEAHVLLAFATGESGEMRAVENRPMAAVALPLAVASVGAGARLVMTWPRVEGLPEGWAVTLRDTQTGATVDLATAAQYAFSVAPAAARPEGAAPAGARSEAVASRFWLTVGPRGATAGEGGAAAALSLDAPRPNPSRGTATVAFSLPEARAVRLTVVDLLGREVAVLVDGETAAGPHTVPVDAARLAPGVYVVRLATGTETLTRRLVVVR